jgi:mono/diheme cytochrome c family protein
MASIGTRAWRGPLIAAALLAVAGSAIAQDFSRYSGADLYKRFCASCHGIDGRGDGPVAGTFKAPLPDLARLARRAGGTFPEAQVRRIIDGRDIPAPHGARDMPVWGTELAASTTPGGDTTVASLVDRLVAFLRSIQTPVPM